MGLHGVMKIRMLLAVCCLWSTGHAEQVEKVFEGKVELAVGYRYLLGLPERYEADAGKRWPLIVFLHGAGERGDDLELLKRHGPPKLIEAGRNFDRFSKCLSPCPAAERPHWRRQPLARY
jgi:hypothetical protein